jgi:hypothetical protein
MTHLHVAVLARAAVAGQAKTRLIPALGAERAAALQAHLTERALRRATASGAEVVLWVAVMSTLRPCACVCARSRCANSPQAIRCADARRAGTRIRPRRLVIRTTVGAGARSRTGGLSLQTMTSYAAGARWGCIDRYEATGASTPTTSPGFGKRVRANTAAHGRARPARAQLPAWPISTDPMTLPCGGVIDAQWA